MGLFSRRAQRADDAVPEEADATSESSAQETDAADGEVDASVGPDGGHGPWDASEVAERGPRLDLGAVWLPALPGMQMRMEVDKKSSQVTGVAVMIDGSALQVQAFAAPRTEGIWDEIREEIAASLRTQGADVQEAPGRFGTELHARMNATDPSGASVQRAIRFIGYDGPRWFLRGVITGKAATDAAAATALEGLFAGVVVVRDQTARAPRDLLALTMPEMRRRPAPEQPARPALGPLERGPEITEIG
ncbi:MAG: DUF3710 domain-containing protein [Cellulomonadaceae bacterium]